MKNTAIAGVAVVAGIIVGAYAGVAVALPTALISASGSAMASVSVIGGAVIVAGGVSLVDRLNPVKQVSYLKFSNRATSGKFDRVKDIDALASSLNQQLKAL